MLKTAAVVGLFTILIVITVILLNESTRGQIPSAPTPASATEVPTAFYGYEVVHEYPHDPEAFTQGLIYNDGFLYESTGMRGQSSVRKVRLETGEVVQRHTVNSPYVAEGLTEWRGRLIQLTPKRSKPGLGPGNRIWQDPSALWTTVEGWFGREPGVTYDGVSLTPQSTFTYRYEGWGLTHDDRRLILSNGTSNIRFLDPQTFRQIGSIDVTDKGEGIPHWNELEFIKGEIYANMWLQDRIGIINPETGQIRAWIINLAELRSRLVPPPKDAENLGAGGHAMLNGIAYDAFGDRLFVTGKLWPRLFEIRLHAVGGSPSK
jgi:glutaminyl-peptide cyclotransferase